MTHVAAVEETLVTTKERRALFGLVKWHEVVATDSLGNDLYVTIDRPLRKLYINGKVIDLSEVGDERTREV